MANHITIIEKDIDPEGLQSRNLYDTCKRLAVAIAGRRLTDPPADALITPGAECFVLGQIRFIRQYHIASDTFRHQVTAFLDDTKQHG